MVRLFFSVLFLGVLISACKENRLSVSPELQEALNDFEIAEGFRIELVAAEPLVADPVAMEIDENGVFYVVEMHGYPLDLSGSGMVKILRDTDNDGLPDRSVVFADQLILPTGIMKWEKGVLVTDPPNVWYLEDTDGDDKADIRKILLTGFALSNPQHNLNTPVFGLDNWIYMAHQWAITPIVYTATFGDEGTEVYFPDSPESPRLPRNADDRNVRFRPDSRELEVLSGNSQFGQTFDPWGHQLLNENAHHLYHEVIADRYLRGNPHLLVPDVVQDIPDHGNACEVYPITENPQHQLLTDVGVITSACGVTWYQGGIFPAPFNENCTFVAEPVHNLIHVDRIQNNGATFTASRILENQEFLASKDANFRPCNFYTGPDGALYVVDYYRPIIEHPEWMSEEVNNSGKLYEGSDKGRIYRIVPEKGPAMDWIGRTRLGSMTDEALAGYLDDPNIWYRRTAQRLLYQRKSGAVEAIRKVASGAKSPEGRLHALWLLEGLGGLDASLIEGSLVDEHPGVRENAIKIAELHFRSWPELRGKLIAMAADKDPKVRYQLLCTLGFLEESEADRARLAILENDLADPWVPIAALTAASGREMKLFDLAVVAFQDKDAEATARFFTLLAASVGNADQQAEVLKLFRAAVAPAPSAKDAIWHTAVLEGLRRLWERKGVPKYIGEPEKKLLLENFNADVSGGLRKTAVSLLKITGLPASGGGGSALKDATHWAAAKETDENLRADALQLLALSDAAVHRLLFENCLAPDQPESVQKAALVALGTIPGKGILTYSLANWNHLTADLKDLAIGQALATPERMHLLLDAVSDGKIKASFVSWPRQVRLMNNDDLEVRAHARSVLALPENSNRQEVVERYQAALQGAGSPEKGRLVFETACGQCHQMQGIGRSFGPDLASIRNRDPRFIMADILDPNRSIADAFEMWTVELKDGKMEAGVISSETSAAITVKNLAGQETTIPRTEIRSLEASPQSGMPEGLEHTISIEQMRDLLAFLKKG